MVGWPTLFDFDFPLPGVNVAASIPTRRNHAEWGSSVVVIKSGRSEPSVPLFDLKVPQTELGRARSRGA